MRIGEMLVADGRLSSEQVAEARRTQRRLGGRLGTSLLELGVVDEEVLLETLGRQRSTRTVSASELAKAPASVVRLIPAKLAERYGIVPYQLKGRTLFVASRDIGDPLKEDEIGFLTSCLVRSCIALEFRIYEALERHYKIPCHPRNAALARRLEARRRGPESGGPAGGGGGAKRPDGHHVRPPAARVPAAETPAVGAAAGTPAAPPRAAPATRRGTARPAPRADAARPKKPPAPKKPPRRFIELDAEDAALLGGAATDPGWAPAPVSDQPVLLAPTPLPWLARESAADDAEAAEEEPAADAEEAVAARPVAARPVAARPVAARPSSVESPRAGVAAPPPAGGETASVALSIEEWLRNAASELKHAEIRDDIADVLLAFCEPFLRRRLLLTARRDRIVGWRGEGVERDRVRALEIPVGEPSVFLGLTGSDSFWLGALAPLPANQPLIDALGGEAPKECVVLPVVLRSRVVCYLYGDNLDAGVGGVPVAQLRRLAAKAGLAFEVCILKNKMRIL